MTRRDKYNRARAWGWTPIFAFFYALEESDCILLGMVIGFPLGVWIAS